MRHRTFNRRIGINENINWILSQNLNHFSVQKQANLFVVGEGSTVQIHLTITQRGQIIPLLCQKASKFQQMLIQ